MSWKSTIRPAGSWKDTIQQEDPDYDWANAPGDMLKTQLDALPLYGQAAGSLVGPVAAGALQAAGSSLKNGLYGVADLVTGKRSWEDELRMPSLDETASVVNDAVENFNYGATGEMGGRIAGKGLQQLGSAVNKGFSDAAITIRPPQRKANADEIIAAAKELGIDVTPGMLDDSGFVERLESTLAKSPSVLGQSIARRQQDIQRGLQQTVEDVTSEAHNLSPFQTGEKFKSGITAAVGERLDPLAATFQDVSMSTKNIPINPNSVQRVGRNIENLDLYSLGVGSEKAKRYVDALPRLKNADQVKTLMSLLNDDIKASDGAERQVLSAIKDKLARLEENSIMRAAIQTARESGGAMKSSSGEKIGRDIISELGSARQGYRELANDLYTTAKEARLRPEGSPNSFLNMIEQIPSERIQDKFFNVENNRQLVDLQNKFPELYSLLKQGKLKDILDSSVDNSVMGQGQLSPNRFLKEIRSLNPEAASMLFGDGTKTIKNLETVQKSIPRNFNPSGTASTQGWADALYQNAKDVPNYLLYKGASSNLVNKISEGLVKSPQMLELKNTNPQAFERLVSSLISKGIPADKSKKEDGGKPIFDQKKILGDVQGTQYGQILQNAADRGPQSFGAAHYVLSQRDPKYRSLVLKDED